MMTSPISASTLERFRADAASGRPTPAGVAVAAVSASFALGLLAKALAVSARKSTGPHDAPKLQSLADAARAESTRMAQFADDDVAAFDGFLAAARLPQSTDQERLARRQTVESALLQTVDVPLAAARSAAAGVQLCVEAAPLTHRVVLADLGAAATLLCAALRVFLLCAESNVRQLAGDAPAHRERLSKEADRHSRALLQGGEVIERVTAALEAAAPSAAPQDQP